MSIKLRTRWAAIGATAAVLAGTGVGLSGAPASAVSGILDPAFAGAGRAVIAEQGYRVVGLDDLPDDRFVSVAIRSGAKTDQVEVRRMLPNGLPDAGFAADGAEQVGGGVSWATPSIAFEPRTGSTYVSAYSSDTGSSRIWKFDPFGVQDPTWGNGATAAYPGTNISDLAVTPQGQVLIARGASLYRLLANGVVDPAFGVAGGATLPTGAIDSLQVLSNGDILVGGRTTDTVDVFRLNPNGGLDGGFGTNGRAFYRATPAIGYAISAMSPASIDTQNDGSVVLASNIIEKNPGGNTRNPLLVVRFTRGGALDGKFIVHRDYPVSLTGKLRVQANDKIVVPVLNGDRAAVVRLLPDGGTDVGFGVAGGWTDTVNGSRAWSVITQRPGRIVVGGLVQGGNGVMWGLLGDTTPTCLGKYATAYGDNGPDEFIGTDGDDVIVGNGGKDKITTGKGADRVCAGGGKDKVSTGGGNDKIDGGAKADVLRGGAGKDTIAGGGGNDKLYGGPGNDTLKGGRGDDWLYGGSGKDKLKGGPGNDRYRR